VLPDMIEHAASTGDVSAFAQRYWERETRFNRGFSTGLHFSVLCAEDVRFIQPQDVPSATEGTFLGRYLIDEYQRACALWPIADLRPDFRQAVSVSTPTLLISGAFDPVTPPAFAARVARSLTSSRLLVASQGAHGSAGWCADAAISFLQKATFPGAPPLCR
jgi:pimeloyl-ACP methyl ester carboxylesterase